MTSLKAQAEVLSKLKDISAAIDKSGAVALKMGLDDLRKSIIQDTNDLRALSLEYQNLTDIAKEGFKLDRDLAQIDILKNAFTSYGDTIQKVYDAQNSAHNEVLDIVRAMNLTAEEMAKKTATVVASIMETEIKANEAKLSNYRAYYDELKKLQKTYYDVMVKSTAELARIEKEQVSARRTTQGLLYDVWNKAHPPANEMEEWTRKEIQLQDQLAYALTLTGDARVKAIQDYQKAAGEMKSSVTVSETERRLVTTGQGFDTSTDFKDVTTTRAFDMTQDKIRMILTGDQLIQESLQQMASDAQSNLTRAAQGFTQVTDSIKTMEAAIRTVESIIVDLDAQLAKQRVFSIDASPALAELQKVLDAQARVNAGLFPGIQTPAAPAPPAKTGIARPRSSTTKNPPRAQITFPAPGSMFSRREKRPHRRPRTRVPQSGPSP